MITSSLNNVIGYYTDLFEHHSDPRTKEWFLISSIWIPLTMLLIYFWISSSQGGPSLMKDRPVVEVGNFLTFYNLFILVLNGGLTIFFLYYQVKLQYSPLCQPVSTKGELELVVCVLINATIHLSSLMWDSIMWEICISGTDLNGEKLVKWSRLSGKSLMRESFCRSFWFPHKQIELAKGFYVFYISKICELTDTLMIILKKKPSQLTFLHRYHHSSMVMIVWLGVRFAPGGSSIVLAAINTFFHFIIYAYYYLSLLQLKIVTLLPFRSVTTFSQLIQFALAIIHCMSAYIKNCGYPQSVLVWLICYVASFFCLFIWFIYLNTMCSETCTTCTINNQATNNSSSRQNPAEPGSDQLVNHPGTTGIFPSKTSPRPKISPSPSLTSNFSNTTTEYSSDETVDRIEIKMQTGKRKQLGRTTVKKVLREKHMEDHLSNESTLLPIRNSHKMKYDRQLMEKVSYNLKTSKKNCTNEDSTPLRKTSRNPHLHLDYSAASAKNSFTNKMSVIGSLMEVNRNFNSRHKKH